MLHYNQEVQIPPIRDRLDGVYFVTAGDCSDANDAPDILTSPLTFQRLEPAIASPLADAACALPLLIPPSLCYTPVHDSGMP